MDWRDQRIEWKADGKPVEVGMTRFGSGPARAVDLPVIGPALYRLNVNGPVIGMMARGHVYADPAWLTPERMAAKRAMTEAPGARHASFRFVAGELDPFTTRDDCLDAARERGCWSSTVATPRANRRPG